MGQNSVTVHGLPQVDRVINRFRRSAGEILQREGEQVMANATRRWPRRNRRKYSWIKRPHSADLFRIVFRENGSTLSFTVYNDAKDGQFGKGDNPYVFMIKTIKNGVIGSPWQLLIRRPVKEAIKKVARQLTDAAQEALGHGS